MVCITEGKRIKSVLVSLLITVSVGYSQNTLDYYIKSALENSPALKESISLSEKTKIRENIIRAEYRQPKIYLSGDVYYPPLFPDKNDPKAIGFDVSITDGGLYSALLNIQQPLFNKSFIETNNIKLKAEREAYTNRSDLTKHQLEKEVTDRYILSYKIFTQIIFVRSVKELLEQQKVLIESLAKGGIYNKSDILLINIEIQNRVMELADLQSLFDKSIADLNEMCGLPNNPAKELTSPGITLNIISIKSKFLEKYKIDSIQSVSDLQVANLKYKPRFNLYGNTGINAIELQGIQRKFGVGIGINMIIPIYDGHQKKYSGQEIDIDLGIIRNYRQNFIIRNQTRLNSILNDLKNIDHKIQSCQLQLNNYEALIDLYKAKLQLGEVKMIDYMNIMRLYVSVNNELSLSEANKLLIINENNFYNW